MISESAGNKIAQVDGNKSINFHLGLSPDATLLWRGFGQQGGPVLENPREISEFFDCARFLCRVNQHQNQLLSWVEGRKVYGLGD
jgi:hypothetical protein